MRPYARIPAARASRSAKVHLPAIRWERRLSIRTSAVRQSTASTIRTAVAVPAIVDVSGAAACRCEETECTTFTK